MQIILLSGGSGMRLWPLSNDARAKQFLPVLPSPKGGVESMVQRVIRQIGESRLYGEITLAANESQQDIITNQLGNSVDVVKEPERRDTFPAIALTCSHLKYNKGYSDDEVIIVIPCDTYVESKYFDAVAAMGKAVEDDLAELVLMGVRPTYPSTKYGYIVPAEQLHGYQIQKVKSFVEKPDLERAEELLEEWAYWNGGVFAFRLGYLMNKLNQYIKADSYEQVRERYNHLPQISFDYEVVEKEPSALVVPFSGTWKDLGTWNTLTEELHYDTIGNVVSGKNNVNSHVINELDLPIFCDGLENIVVACSPDGIIVSSKKCSENIKYFVNSLCKRPMYEERRWGTYQVLKSGSYANGMKYLTKSLKINAGKSISYQIHHQRKEIWAITEGTGIVVLDDVPREVSCGDVIVIEKEQKHCIKAITDIEFIEVQLGTNLVEGDIERFPWEWE